MKKKIKLKINSQEFSANDSETILEVAERNGIEIPTLCNHPDFCVKGNCRVCVVEVTGVNKLLTACSTVVQDGMEILTESERVKKVRNVNIELIYAEHVEKCATCVWRFECKLLAFAQKYKTKIVRFEDRKKNRQFYKMKNALEIDGSQCIDCRNCITACRDLQKLDCLEMKGRGHGQEIGLKDEKKNPCILCGQCALHCPVSAIQEQTSYTDFEREIGDKEKIVVVVLDPIIEVSIGEHFGGKKIELNSVASALKKMGADYVFGSGFGVEVISYIQAEQITESSGNELFLGSQCPSFVNYVRQYRPELTKNLQKIKSPANLMGGFIKTYWAQKQGIDPFKISVVSVGVCVARKAEVVEKRMQFNTLWPIDVVLTLRELSFLLKKNKLDLVKSKKSDIDLLGNEPADLRSANVFASISGRLKNDDKTNDVRGKNKSHGNGELLSLQSGNVKKIASLKGVGDFGKIPDNIEEYKYLEVMVCPSGCFGGGGQPIPTNDALRKERKRLFTGKKMQKNFAQAQLDDQITDVLKWLVDNKLENLILF